MNCCVELLVWVDASNPEHARDAATQMASHIAEQRPGFYAPGVAVTHAISRNCTEIDEAARPAPEQENDG